MLLFTKLSKSFKYLVKLILKTIKAKAENFYLAHERTYLPYARRVSVQGVESLWGDCRFIPAD